MDRSTRFGVTGFAVATLAALALAAPRVAQAQCQHGASIFKTCESVKRKLCDRCRLRRRCRMHQRHLRHFHQQHDELCNRPRACRYLRRHDEDQRGLRRRRLRRRQRSHSAGGQPPDTSGLQECGLLRGSLASLLRRTRRLDLRHPRTHDWLWSSGTAGRPPAGHRDVPLEHLRDPARTTLIRCRTRGT